MDAEETNRLLAQATLRALSLEINRDVEVLRAQKLRDIISALAVTIPELLSLLVLSHNAVRNYRQVITTHRIAACVSPFRHREDL